MGRLKDQAIIWSDRLALNRLIAGPADRQLTTILFHHFRIGDESWDTARERLRRQCDFMATHFRPVTVGETLDLVADGGGTGRPLLVTIDDAKREILEVFDVFEAFGIPIIQFVCAGWSELSDPGRTEEGLLLRLVIELHFYEGPARQVQVGGQAFTLDGAGNAALIDAAIEAAGTGGAAALADLETLDPSPDPGRSICDWSELRDLQARGMAMGCHSVSHPRIARQSERRQRFEIAEGRRFIEARLGDCPHFAYPYGTPEAHDVRTRSALQAAGFAAGFTTHPGFAEAGHDPLTLPRIVLPDTALSPAAFAARVRGGGIPLTRLKERLA